MRDRSEVESTIDYDVSVTLLNGRGEAPSASRGRRLGDFELGDELGRGGFGTVYQAVQRGLAREAVVKVFHRSHALHAESAARFELEAKLAARFDHPYAAHIYAFGIERDATMWLAMERVKGLPLGELVARSGPLALDRFVPLFERLCEVVQAAHDVGIVHRDVKPSNVMVIAQGGRLIPKLLDFGVAKLVETVDVAASVPLGPEHAAERTLTRDGQILGSPTYMAPEQWCDAAAVGPAADQYALALLAYEALTGALPYAATTLEALCYQHLHVELPALPSNLPSALNDALARGSNKDANARFATVSELAAAVRNAAFGPPETSAPALPADVARRWIADAPRPIAESLAALVNRGSVERVRLVVGVLARWLGVLALACRSRLSPIDSAESEAARVLRELRRRPLVDAEWLELALELTRPFATRPELWPIPELAATLASQQPALHDLLREATCVAADLVPGDMYQRLEAILGGLGWLCEYELVREVAGGLEKWHGLRIDGTTSGVGDLVVLDGDGARVVRLSPLAQVAAPLAGGAEEIFVISGPGRNDGARLTSYPRGFERDDDEVWDWLAAHVLDAGPRCTENNGADRPPYPGLAAYSVSDHASFVGRERDVEELVNRLRTQPLVAIVAPSGAGKSSFLAAGLLPALPARWQAALLRPGKDPLASLAAAVPRTDAPPYREDRKVVAGEQLAAHLVGAAERAGTLVIIVDQAEELFTMCSDPAARAAFAETIARATAHPAVRCVLALRDDFLCHAEELGGLRGLVGPHVQVLRTLDRGDLERVLTVPARRRGYEFDDPTLPGEIAALIAGRPGALPLLAFAAAELWEHRDRHFQRLTRAAYVQLGGVAGALVQHADGALSRMPAGDRRLVRIAFRRLLAGDGARTMISRAELESVLGPKGSAVIDRLIAARLVVSRDGELGDRIEIVHETLATAWPQLATWRSEDAIGARLEQQLAAAARSWDERGRASDMLWRGAALIELERWQATGDDLTSQLERAFIAASRRTAQRHRRRQIGAIAGAFVLLVVAIAILVSTNRTIGDQRTAAVDRVAANLEERARLAITRGDDARGMLYLAEASRLGAQGTAVDVLASHAATSIGAGIEIIGRLDVGIRKLDRTDNTMLALGADFSLWRWDDGRRRQVSDGAYCSALLGDVAFMVSRTGDLRAIARTGTVQWRAAEALADAHMKCGLVAGSGLVVTFGKTSRVWDARTGALRATLTGSEITAVAIDKTGALIATGDRTGGVRVWRPGAATPIATCPSHRDLVRVLRFSPDGHTIVSGGNDGDVRICDATTGHAVHQLVGHSQSVLVLDISGDGNRIVSGGRDGKPRVWDARTGTLVAVLDGHDGMVLGTFWSPDGARILTLGMDSTARIWDRTGMPLAALQGHGGPVLVGGWDNDGRHIVTASFDGAIRRWTVDDATRGALVEAHAGGVTDLVIARDDRSMLTTGADHVAAVRELRTGRPLVALAHPSPVTNGALSPDRSAALTTDESGAARLWRLPDGSLQATLPLATAAVFAPDGTVITAGGGLIRFWTRDGIALGSVDCPYPVTQLVVDPRGRWVFARGMTNATNVIAIDRREVVARLPIDDAYARWVAVDPTRVAITDGMTVRMWQLGTWLPIGQLAAHRSLVTAMWFLPDGRLASAAFDGTFVWRDAHLLARLPDVGHVYALAASRDGALLATTGTDGLVRIWDAASYRELLRLPSHRSAGRVLAFSNDGATVISGGYDGQLAIWNIERRARTAAELAEIVRCRVPLRLEGDVVLPRDLDFDDPSCR